MGRVPRSVYGATAWNLAANAIPVLVGLFAIPRLISGMGETRFGLLTLVWALIGYFGIFDLGLGRAITQAVSQALGRRTPAEVREIYLTGTNVLLVAGLAGTALLLTVRSLVARALSLPPGLDLEFRRALLWVGLAIPFATVASASRGVLEGKRRFADLSAARIPYGVLSFVTPLLFPSSMQDVGAVAFQLAVLRALLAVWQSLICKTRLGLRFSLELHLPVLAKLLRFGGWLTLTNVVGPLMVNADRFIIAALASASVVAYYTTPYEIVTRLLVLPAALSTTLFPLLGQGLIEDPATATRLYVGAKRILIVASFGACFLVGVLGHELMVVWVGTQFAERARTVLVLLSIGVFFNGLAFLPYTILQSVGNSRATALAHILELMVYVPVLAILVLEFGIVGASVAWVVRAFGDLVLLEWQALNVAGAREPASGVLLAVLLALALALSALLAPFWARLALTALVAAGAVGYLTVMRMRRGATAQREI